MGLLFELSVLLLLAFIAVELYLLRADLARLPFLLRQVEEKKDSPTINVNVGTMAPAPMAEEAKAPETPAAVAAIPSGDGAELEAEAEELPEPTPAPQAEPHRSSITVNQTPSGIVALKCPACQAENSSYRSECFNCGAPLH